MNIEYVRSSFYSGYVSNEKGEINNREYLGNIEEILMTENKIELLEKELEMALEHSKELDSVRRKRKIFGLIMLTFIEMYVLIAAFIIPIFSSHLFIEQIVGTKLDIIIIGQFFVIPALGEIIRDYYQDLKKRKALDLQIDYLKESLEEAKAKLEDLNKSKSIDHSMIVSDKIKLNPKVELEKIKQTLFFIEDYIRNHRVGSKENLENNSWVSDLDAIMRKRNIK